MLALVKQIAEQAQHDRQRTARAKREKKVREAEAVQAAREAELAEHLAKLEEEHLRELQGLMEGLNTEVMDLLNEDDAVAAKPSKDAEVKRASESIVDTLGEFARRGWDARGVGCSAVSLSVPRGAVVAASTRRRSFSSGSRPA